MLLTGLSLALFIPGTKAIEVLYGQWIYPSIRLGFHLISWVPFPVIYIFLILILFLFIRAIRSTHSPFSKTMRILLGVIVIVFLFYWLWAYNYRRNPFSTRYPISISPLDNNTLRQEFALAKSALISSRPDKLMIYSPVENEVHIREAIKKICAQYGYTSPGKIRVKALYPRGTLLSIKTAGFYMPFTGEAYVDAGLHPIQLGFTQAHEMCHGYGVTDEGACNFLAYMALTSLGDSTMAYSGHLGYYRYIAGTYRYFFPDDYVKIRETLPKTITDDLDEINKAMMKYPDVFPILRDMIYDRYLKVQGVKEGMASYDKIIDFVRQARKNGQIQN